MLVILRENSIGRVVARDVIDPADVKSELRQQPSDQMQAWSVSKQPRN